MPFGAFVQLLPGKDGLLHISELGEGHVDTVESVVNIGDEVKVIVKKVDDMGRVDLSTKIDHYLTGPGFEELAEEKNNRRNRNPRNRDSRNRDSRNRDNDSRRRSVSKDRNRPRPPDLRN